VAIAQAGNGNGCSERFSRATTPSATRRRNYLRLRKSSAFSREAAITPRADDHIALRLQVARTLHGCRNFSLHAGSGPVWNAFVNPDELAAQIGPNGRANLVLLGPDFRGERTSRFTSFRRQWNSWRDGNARHPFVNFDWFRAPFDHFERLTSAQTAENAVRC